MKPKLLLLFIALLALHNHMQAQYLHHMAGNTSLLHYSGDDSLAIYSNFANPFELFIDKAGDVYLACDTGSYATGYIRKISKATGIITRIAGGGAGGATGEGLTATATHIYHTPYGICMDTAGNLLFTDSARVRRIDKTTNLVTTIAGKGVFGHGGDGGPATAAEFISPSALAIDSVNNLYVADGGNYNIRRVDAVTGVITTIAGNWKSSWESGDGGPATAAELWKPSGLYIDHPGRLYVADGIMVRVIDLATGIINAFAGIATGGGSDPGTIGPATAISLRMPYKLTGDKNGNIYVTEYSGPWLRKVNIATGIMTSYAGNDTGNMCKVSNDGHPATVGGIIAQGICIDTCNNIYVLNGALLWKITPGPDDVPCNIDPALAVSATAQPMNELAVFPNPANRNFTIQLPANNSIAHIVITNAMGTKIKELTAPAGAQQNIQLNGPPGNYFVNVQSGAERWYRQVVISE